ncbi:MAG: hypothetical protein EOO43_22920 [Flavobacterium sp.]|nr:MAG: hypothetical protein EOO43_22920 [Flavobacterium sp.]
MDVNSIRQFGLNICPMTAKEITDFVAKSIISKREPLIISGINAYAVVCAQKDQIFRSFINQSTIVNIDGFSIVMALRLLGYKVKQRVACSDIFHGLFKLADTNNYSIYLLGAHENVVKKAAKNLELQYTDLGFEKPYTPVYIEVEAHLVKSDTTTITGGYDSTMVVTKVLKVLKDIPEGPCNQ